MTCSDNNLVYVEIGKFPKTVCSTLDLSILKKYLFFNELVSKLAGSLLRRLPWFITRRALAYYHVLYQVYTQDDVDPYLVLLAALNLASKVEDMALCLRALLREFDTLPYLQGAAAVGLPLPGSAQAWLQAITQVECEILRLLAMDPSFDLPFASIKKYFAEHKSEGHLLKVASSFANDMFVTPLCLVYPAPALAAAAVVLSFKGLDRMKTYRYFGVQSEQIDEIFAYMKSLYALIRTVQAEEASNARIKKELESKMMDEDDCDDLSTKDSEKLQLTM